MWDGDHRLLLFVWSARRRRPLAWRRPTTIIVKVCSSSDPIRAFSRGTTVVNEPNLMETFLLLPSLSEFFKGNGKRNIIATLTPRSRPLEKDTMTVLPRRGSVYSKVYVNKSTIGTPMPASVLFVLGHFHVTNCSQVCFSCVVSTPETMTSAVLT